MLKPPTPGLLAASWRFWNRKSSTCHGNGPNGPGFPIDGTNRKRRPVSVGTLSEFPIQLVHNFVRTSPLFASISPQCRPSRCTSACSAPPLAAAECAVPGAHFPIPRLRPPGGVKIRAACIRSSLVAPCRQRAASHQKKPTRVAQSRAKLRYVVGIERSAGFIDVYLWRPELL